MNDLGKREAHKEATRARLLRAAETLFAEHGFHATTVHAIAEAAGVTERTFFRYFSSKDELVSTDMDDWLATLEQALQRTDPTLPPLLSIEQAVLDALDAPGPIGGWLFPTDAAGKPGQKTNATAGVAARIGDIILRWQNRSTELPERHSSHPIAERRVADRFRAGVLARVGVGIVRMAVTAAGQTAALDGTPMEMSLVKQYVSEGFALLRSSPPEADANDE